MYISVIHIIIIHVENVAIADFMATDPTQGSYSVLVYTNNINTLLY